MEWMESLREKQGEGVGERERERERERGNCGFPTLAFYL